MRKALRAAIIPRSTGADTLEELVQKPHVLAKQKPTPKKKTLATCKTARVSLMGRRRLELRTR
jgi:hypothetical protein